MATDIENLDATISGYLTQLAADAAGKPGINYSINGLSMDRTSWRAGVMQIVKDLRELRQTLQPFVITTHQYP